MSHFERFQAFRSLNLLVKREKTIGSRKRKLLAVSQTLEFSTHPPLFYKIIKEVFPFDSRSFFTSCRLGTFSFEKDYHTTDMNRLVINYLKFYLVL